MLVVVDTEEEFDWSRPFSRESTATTSIAAQSLMHERVFDHYGAVPTYVVDWPVATTPDSIASLRSIMESNRCEIGTHLHPWVSPPHEEEVNTFNSYAGNLAPALEFAKLRTLTEAITANFGRAPITFKAGRYGVGSETASAIARLGYKVDASVVPYTSFRGDGGPDFTWAGEHPYWFEADGHTLLELPVTTGFSGHLRHAGPRLFPALQSPSGKRLRLPGIAARSGMLERIRLTPEGCTASDMIRLLDSLVAGGCKVFSLTYHSPSMVAGHTPYVRDARELDQFIKAVDDTFRHFRDRLGGCFMGIAGLHSRLLARRANVPEPVGAAA
jgi:hypothetical protein